MFGEYLDQRTFYQRTAEKKSPAYWTRDGNLFRVSGRLAVSDVLELHYYRRLPALNATYAVVAATYNIDSGLFTRAVDSNMTAIPDINSGTANQVPPTDVLWFSSADTDFTTAFDVSQAGGDVGRQFVGSEVGHWLRDENERILLFGALTEAFIYLEEDTMIDKYKTLFELEIEELNREEKMRQAVGGNVSKNFNGRGLI